MNIVRKENLWDNVSPQLNKIYNINLTYQCRNVTYYISKVFQYFFDHSWQSGHFAATERLHFSILGAVVNQLATDSVTVFSTFGVSGQFAKQSCIHVSFSWKIICKTNVEQTRTSRRSSCLDEQMLVMMLCEAKYEYGCTSVHLGKHLLMF